MDNPKLLSKKGNSKQVHFYRKQTNFTYHLTICVKLEAQRPDPSRHIILYAPPKQIMCVDFMLLAELTKWQIIFTFKHIE